LKNDVARAPLWAKMPGSRVTDKTSEQGHDNDRGTAPSPPPPQPRPGAFLMHDARCQSALIPPSFFFSHDFAVPPSPSSIQDGPCRQPGDQEAYDCQEEAAHEQEACYEACCEERRRNKHRGNNTHMCTVLFYGAAPCALFGAVEATCTFMCTVLMLIYSASPCALFGAVETTRTCAVLFYGVGPCALPCTNTHGACGAMRATLCSVPQK
jgi:hypothetical protein